MWNSNLGEGKEGYDDAFPLWEEQGLQRDMSCALW